MKKYLILSLFFLSTITLFSQKKEEAERLVNEGIELHDKGEYQAAISKYDEALKLDKDNFLALGEKAFSLLMLEKNEEAIKCCKRAIDKNKGKTGLESIYVTWGNALDGLHNPESAIEIYDEGISQFPDFYQLHFNKGITLSGINRIDEAILCFQKSMTLNPKHPGSQNAIARMLNYQRKRIPAILAFSRFLALEPEGSRAAENLTSLQKLMKANVEKKDDQSVTININPDILADTTADGKPGENSFTTADLILSMNTSLDYSKEFAEKTEVEKFVLKFQTLCSTLKESAKDGYGFYWDYYVPYFVEMEEKQMIETFSYIAFASLNDAGVSKWLKTHSAEIAMFFDWSNAFKWKQD